MPTDVIRDDKMQLFLKDLKAYTTDKPIRSFVTLYQSFKRNFSKEERAALEIEYVGQEYAGKFGEQLDGRRADLVSFLQTVMMNPEIVFDTPHVFQNATRLILGLPPNYTEALYTPSYQYAEAYTVLNYLLNIPYTLSPLSTEVADVIAISVHKDGSNYFPDKRVTEFSIPQLISGDNTAFLFRIKKMNNLFHNKILPAIYNAENMREFAKRLKKFYSENSETSSSVYQAMPMLMLIATTFFKIKETLSKKD